MAEQFLHHLPQIPITDLPPNSECPICKDEYYTTNEVGSSEIAVMLPCQHVIGGSCIKSWLSPTKEAKNSCPYCRREFFPLQTSPEPDDGHGNDEFGRIMDLLDADWDAQAEARRTRRPRERQLYRRFIRTSIRLPSLIPGGGRLTPSQHEALFQELERQGTFNIMYFEEAFINFSAVMPNRGLWRMLRQEGLVYHPRTMSYSGCGSCGWHLDIVGTRYLRSANAEEYQG